MPQMTAWVHQYALRELLDDTFDLFKERATALLLAGLIPYAIAGIYVAAMRAFVIPGAILRDISWHAVSQMVQSWAFWGFVLGLVAISWITGAAGYVAQCRIAAAHALGAPITLRRAFALMAKPFWSLVVVGALFVIIASTVSNIVGMVMMFVGILLIALTSAVPVLSAIVAIIVVALVLVAMEVSLIVSGTYFLAAPMSLAYEHAGPFAAIGRGFRAASANFRAHCVVLYAITRVPVLFLPVLVIISFLAFNAVRYISPTFNIFVIQSLLWGFGMVAFTGLLACFQALVFIDGRCRSEAFDLLMLARSIGLGSELEQALAPGRPQPTAAYPDYSSAPAAPLAAAPVPSAAPAATAAFPDYSAPPEGQVVTFPSAEVAEPRPEEDADAR